MSDANQLARMLITAAGRLDPLTRAELTRLGEEVELIFSAHAPRRTGRLGRGVRARFIGGDILVSAVAVEPKSGYDYVGVTRFGHRKLFIYPVQAKALAFRPVKGGKMIFRKRVRGYRPTHDWTEDAHPEIRLAARRATERMGDRVFVRLDA